MSTFDGWDDELYHHGILGQKWGIRRYQNADGSWTEAGLRRKATLDRKANKKEARKEKKASKKQEKLERKKEKKPKLYSPAELRERIERLELEKRYKDLYRDIHSNSFTKFGKEFVTKSLMDAEGIAALGIRNSVNWWTEKTPIERAFGIGTKAAEAAGNLVGSVSKLRGRNKGGGKDNDDKNDGGKDNDDKNKKKPKK